MADQPFAQARAKLQEHHDFAIGESTIQRITFAHAEAMHESHRRDLEFPETPGLSKPIVVETDGGMVPIVEPNSEGKDKRKGKTLWWREAKLSLAHAQGNCTPVYAGSIEGGVEEAGRQLLCLTRFAPASGRTPGSTRGSSTHERPASTRCSVLRGRYARTSMLFGTLCWNLGATGRPKDRSTN